MKELDLSSITISLKRSESPLDKTLPVLNEFAQRFSVELPEDEDISLFSPEYFYMRLLN